MYKEIKNYVISCVSCQKRKIDTTPTSGLMQFSPKITGRLFERFTIDYIGPINPSSNGCSYILVGTCATTKYAIFKACSYMNSKTTVAFLLEVISQFGAIDEVSSDRGLHFTAKIKRLFVLCFHFQFFFHIALTHFYKLKQVCF